MTVAERAASYSAAFPAYPPLVTHGRWIYGVFEIGNDYRNKSSLYGAYPPRLLDRIRAIFPEHRPETWLHAFSGSLTREAQGLRVDLMAERAPDVIADVTRLPLATASRAMTAADPPYSDRDAERYGTPMVDRRKAMRELARVTKSGGHLSWLDTVKPMYRNVDWRLFGEIAVVRSTNHRVRMIFLFERV